RRKSSAELPSHRVVGANRAGADLPETAAFGDQVSIGRGAARANRQRRAQGKNVFPAAENRIRTLPPAHYVESTTYVPRTLSAPTEYTTTSSACDALYWRLPRRG